MIRMVLFSPMTLLFSMRPMKWWAKQASTLEYPLARGPLRIRSRDSIIPQKEGYIKKSRTGKRF